ncbi:hypothetical protein [Geodermatophilus sp. CPCC 205761]|uniref:hypothetical protein n=1 Tax=Geodermatophilus sp. CPCC 205761 TaxID=2936597 RepID=UPI003EEE8151
MSLEQDVAAARRAVDALEQACGPLTRRFGDTVDSRRLKIDVARLRDDLNLLCGSARGVEVVGTRAYDPVMWDDGYDGEVSTPGRSLR